MKQIRAQTWRISLNYLVLFQKNPQCPEFLVFLHIVVPIHSSAPIQFCLQNITYDGTWNKIYSYVIKFESSIFTCLDFYIFILFYVNSCISFPII